MARIFICRHGSTPSLENKAIQEPNTPLSEVGKQQAKQLAKRLKDEPVSLFLHSPYLRATQTCNILHKYCPTADKQIADYLRERHYGTHHGKPRDQYLEAVRISGLPREDYCPPGGENYADVYARAMQAWQYIQKASTEHQTIVVISHSVLISNLLAVAMSEPKEAAQEYLKRHQHPTTLNLLEITKNNVTPVLLGDIQHLAVSEKEDK